MSFDSSTSLDSDSTEVQERTHKKISRKLKEMFNENIVKKFEDEDITCLEAIEDLLTKEADASIFSRLGLNYGQAVRFKKEFIELLPTRNATRLTSQISTRTYSYKPSMGKLESLSPEVKRLYLTKRKKIGTLAADHCKGSWPKFNTPNTKADMASFARQISPECAMPEIGFTEEGIMKHIQSFFNEQRRYKSKKSKAFNDCDDNPKLPELPKSDSAESDNSTSVTSQLKKRIKVEKQIFESGEKSSSATDDDMYSQEPATPSTLSIDESDDDSELDCSQQVASPSQAKPSIEVSSSFNVNTCQMIIKAVFGDKLTRDSMLQVLRKKFCVKPAHLTNLSVSQLMHCLANKLLNRKYFSIQENIDMTKLRMDQINVHKEISI